MFGIVLNAILLLSSFHCCVYSSQFEDLFSKETLITHQNQNPEDENIFKFDCKNKEEGTHVEVSSDCTMYHVCERGSKFDVHKKVSTFLCPPGTRFHIESLRCVWWEDVICKDDFSASKPKQRSDVGSPNVSSQSGQRRRRNQRKLMRNQYRNNLLRIDFSLPREAYHGDNSNKDHLIDDEQADGLQCFWCCKPKDPSNRPVFVPATPKPSTEELFSWTPYPVRPTSQPQAVWSPVSTTTYIPSEPFSWIPGQNWVTAKPTLPPSVPLSQIQIIEAKSNQDTNTEEDCANERHSLVVDDDSVLLKFRRFPPKFSAPPEDAIVIESFADEQKLPEVIEAKTENDRRVFHPKK